MQRPFAMACCPALGIGQAAIHVFALLVEGNTAANGDCTNPKDTNDAVDSFSRLSTVDDLPSNSLIKAAAVSFHA